MQQQRTILVHQRNALYFELCTLLQLLKNEIVTVRPGKSWPSCDSDAKVCSVAHVRLCGQSLLYEQTACMVLLFHMRCLWTKAVYFQRTIPCVQNIS